MTVIVAPICGPSSAAISVIIITGAGYSSSTSDWRGGGVDDIADAARTRNPTERRRIDAVGLALLVIGIGSCRLCSTAVKSWTGFHHRKLYPYRGGGGGYLLPDCMGADRDNPIVDLSLFKSRNFTIGCFVSASRICSTSALLFCCRSCSGGLRLHGNVGRSGLCAGRDIPVILSPIIGRFAHKLDMRRW